MPKANQSTEKRYRLVETHQVTLCRSPAFQTVPAWGYNTGGTKTSRALRGADATNDKKAKKARIKVIEKVVIIESKYSV